VRFLNQTLRGEKFNSDNTIHMKKMRLTFLVAIVFLVVGCSQGEDVTIPTQGSDVSGFKSQDQNNANNDYIANGLDSSNPNVLQTYTGDSSTDQDVDDGLEKVKFERVNIGCLPGLKSSDDSFVVRTQSEYEELLVKYDKETREEYKKLWNVTTDEELNKAYPFVDCEGMLTSIDFSKYTLLSLYAEGSGCSRSFDEDVRIDHDNMKVVFDIEVVQQGSCEPLVQYRSYILIPKLEDGYTVEFA
jgi:hypothetical protein